MDGSYTVSIIFYLIVFFYLSNFQYNLENFMQVPQINVLERISQILNGYGFSPTGGVNLYILHSFSIALIIVSLVYEFISGVMLI